MFKGFSQEIPIAVQPKLVVGIVVDQMRYDYLTRYWDRYGEGGFKRLVGEGFNFKNHHFNYVPAATAPGHASVYTGATPSEHGIIGNDWFDIYTDKVIYCVSDKNYDAIGAKSDAGQMSPHRLKKTTVTDSEWCNRASTCRDLWSIIEPLRRVVESACLSSDTV